MAATDGIKEGLREDLETFFEITCMKSIDGGVVQLDGDGVARHIGVLWCFVVMFDFVGTDNAKERKEQRNEAPREGNAIPKTKVGNQLFLNLTKIRFLDQI